MGPTELTEIIKYNNLEGFILQKDDFDFVKRHYPMLMAKYFSDGYDEFHDFVSDTITREIMLEHLEDNYCPDCSSFIESKPDEQGKIEPSKIENERLILESKSILRYDQNSNWIQGKDYNSKNKLVSQIDKKYNRNNKCIETNQKSDITGTSRTKTSYDASGKKNKSFHFELEKAFFGSKEVPDGYTEYSYDNNDLLINEIDFDEQNSVLLKRSYKYDNEKLIERIDNFGKSLFEYNNSGKKITEISYDEYGDFINKTKFEYLNDQLLACGYCDANNNVMSIIKYSYDNYGNMVEEVYYKILDKLWCEKCDKWVYIKKREGPPKIDY